MDTSVIADSSRMNVTRKIAIFIADSSDSAVLPLLLCAVSSADYDSGTFARSHCRRQRHSEILLRGKQFGGEVASGISDGLGATDGHAPAKARAASKCQAPTLPNRYTKLPSGRWCPDGPGGEVRARLVTGMATCSVVNTGGLRSRRFRPRPRASLNTLSECPKPTS